MPCPCCGARTTIVIARGMGQKAPPGCRTKSLVQLRLSLRAICAKIHTPEELQAWAKAQNSTGAPCRGRAWLPPAGYDEEDSGKHGVRSWPSPAVDWGHGRGRACLRRGTGPYRGADRRRARRPGWHRIPRRSADCFTRIPRSPIGCWNFWRPLSPPSRQAKAMPLCRCGWPVRSGRNSENSAGKRAPPRTHSDQRSCLRCGQEVTRCGYDAILASTANQSE